jgi:hypothetical protein
MRQKINVQKLNYFMIIDIRDASFVTGFTLGRWCPRNQLRVRCR